MDCQLLARPAEEVVQLSGEKDTAHKHPGMIGMRSKIVSILTVGQLRAQHYFQEAGKREWLKFFHSKPSMGSEVSWATDTRTIASSWRLKGGAKVSQWR